jgi:hypothetical protein
MAAPTKIRIITVHGYTSAWIYKCIDFGLLLITNKRINGPFLLEITALDVKIVKTPEYYIAKILNKLKLYKVRRSKKALLDEAILGIDSQEYKHNLKLLNNTGLVSVKKRCLEPSMWIILESYFSSLKKFLILKINEENFSLKLLQSTYEGIGVGDIAASETLRQYEGFGGILAGSLALFSCYLNTIVRVKLHIMELNKYNNNNELDAFVMTPDLVYYPETLSRVGYDKGMHVVRADPDFGDYKVESKKESYTLEFPDLMARTEELISRYMENRVMGPSKYLYYMRNCKDLITDTLRDNNENSISLSAEGINFVIFPHLVTDANYWRGLDGYKDLVDWLEATIESALSNRSVRKVLIKFHPNTGEYLGDYLHESYILERYRHNEKVIFLNRDSGLSLFKDSGNVLFITHHGSVAEELTYLRLPNVKWIKSIGSDYNFSQFQWADKSDYENFLKNLKSIPPVLDEHVANLYDFIWDYRLNNISYYEREPHKKFSEFARSNRSESLALTNCPDLAMYSYKFDSSEIVEYHEWLIRDAGNQDFYGKYLNAKTK